MSNDNVIQFPTQLSDKSETGEGVTTEQDTAQRLASKRSANQGALQDLQTRGMSIAPTDIILIRLESLADMVFGPEASSPSRREFELSFEQRIAAVLQDAMKQVFAAQLTNGVNATRKQSGIFLP